MRLARLLDARVINKSMRTAIRTSRRMAHAKNMPRTRLTYSRKPIIGDGNSRRAMPFKRGMRVISSGNGRGLVL